MRTGFFYWETEYYHPDNTFTLNDYLDFHLGEEVHVMYEDGSYCEIMDQNGERYSLHAGGNGDCYSHKIEIEKL